MVIEYKRRDITVDDYHRMAEAGIFAPDERVELIDGELIEMPPIGLNHWFRHTEITEYLVTAIGMRAHVVPQGSYPLGRRNEPQPDFAVLARLDYPTRGLPRLADIFAFIEIADSSASFDRGRKLRMYAEQRVAEYLLVDLRHKRLTLFRHPNDVGYGERRELAYGDRFGFAALPEIELDADRFLGRRDSS